jgi:hypothetical protein
MFDIRTEIDRANAAVGVAPTEHFCTFCGATLKGDWEMYCYSCRADQEHERRTELQTRDEEE